jgi:hypothetical protein
VLDLSCADSPADWAFYAVRVPRLARLHSGFLQTHTSRCRPCRRLVVILGACAKAGTPRRGLSPHTLCPCRAHSVGSSRPLENAAADLSVRCRYSLAPRTMQTVFRCSLAGALLLLQHANSIAQPAPFSPQQVCRATIAALMGRDPAIIKVDRIEGEIVYVTYIRANDGTSWSNRCKI